MAELTVTNYGFTDNQLAELKECFVLFDENGKGSIPSRDLGRCLRAMGQNPSENDVTIMLQNAAIDEVGRLSLDAYLKAVSGYRLKDEAVMREELVEALRVFDRQDVGQLDATELREALRGHGEALTDEDLDEIMNLANVRDDGSFDYMELVSRIVSK